MVVELITPLIPGAGPPPTSNPNLPEVGVSVMSLPQRTEDRRQRTEDRRQRTDHTACVRPICNYKEFPLTGAIRILSEGRRPGWDNGTEGNVPRRNEIMKIESAKDLTVIRRPTPWRCRFFT